MAYNNISKKFLFQKLNTLYYDIIVTLLIKY